MGRCGPSLLPPHSPYPFRDGKSADSFSAELALCLHQVLSMVWSISSISSTGLMAACKSFLGATVRYSLGFRLEVNITSSVDLVEAPSQLWMASPLSVRALTLRPLRVPHSPLRLGLCPAMVCPWDCQEEPGPLPMSLLHGSHGSSLQEALGPFSVAVPVGVPQNRVFLLRTLASRLCLLGLGNGQRAVPERDPTTSVSCPFQTLSVPSGLQGSPAHLLLGFSQSVPIPA